MTPVRGRMTEKELQRSINRALLDAGWIIHHDDTSALVQRVPTAEGGTRWQRTKTNARPGFPDVVAGKAMTLLVWELKADDGRLTPDQIGWLVWWSRFARAVQGDVWAIVPANAPRIHVAVIRPRDLEAAYYAITGYATHGRAWPRFYDDGGS